VGRVVAGYGRSASPAYALDTPRDVLPVGVPHHIVATTDRLILRTWCSDDADGLADLTSHPDVVRYLGEPREADVVIADFNGREEGLGVTTWAIEERSASRLIGWCGYARTNAPWLKPSLVEIGWMLDPKYWGSGFASEAGRSALEVGSRRIEPRRIISKCDVRNERSENVMQRIGLRRSGVVRGGEHPNVVYRLPPV
jgi:RimJ/RimL family protein N-acetyltransferase